MRQVRDRLSAVSAVAVLLAASALWPVFDSRHWLLRTVGAVLVVAVASALARRLRLPRGLAPLLPLVALAGYLVVVFAPGSLAYGVVPGGATVRAFGSLLSAAGEDLAQYAPPAPATEPLVLLVVGGVGLVALVADTVASVAARPAAAGLPLLALFAVPSAVLPGGLGWLPFVLGAAGWLALLLVEGRDAASRWGTALRASAGGAPGLGRVGRRIGGAALGVAVLVPALVPGLDTRLFDGGSGGGGGSGGTRSVTTYNPITRLRGQLTLPEPREVLHYVTDDPSPDYLRMTTLGVYDGAGWRQEVLRGNLRDNGVGTTLPAPLGRSDDARTRTVTTTITIDSLDAFWLPAPATPDRVQVAGPWMWDAGSQSVFATRSNTGRLADYTVHATRVLPDAGALSAGDGSLPAQVQPYSAPVQATPVVRATTAQVVAGQTTEYGKALALQRYFRSGQFTYDEGTTSGGSPDALQDFLQQKHGFCEQYASAMAAMLRLAGVPARVAVGFTPGTRQSDGSYVVTTSDAHAWPEAWFSGLGWVRFEPTPSQGGGGITPPAYGAPPAPTQAAPAPGAPAGPSATDPEGGETALERHLRLREQNDGGTAAPGPAAAAPVAQQGGFPVRRVAAGLLALVAAASPALLHALRRRRRWRTPGAGVAWSQLVEDATDTGHGWRPGDSPRAAGARLVAEAGLPHAAAAAVGRLTAAVERERFARPGTGEAPAGLAADGAAVRRALLAGTSRGRRVRAVLLPPATVRWAASGLGSRTADVLDALDRGLAAVAGRLRRRPA